MAALALTMATGANAADTLNPLAGGPNGMTRQAMPDTTDSLLSTGTALQTSDPAPTSTGNNAPTPAAAMRTIQGMPDSTDQLISTGNALRTSDPFTIPAAR